MLICNGFYQDGDSPFHKLLGVQMTVECSSPIFNPSDLRWTNKSTNFCSELCSHLRVLFFNCGSLKSLPSEIVELKNLRS